MGGMAELLQNAGAVIDALGGTGATARLIGRTDQAVSNWRRTGRLPPDPFLVITAELKKHEKDATPSIWGMVGAAHDAA